MAGAGHTVGRNSSTTELDELLSRARKHFPGAVATHQWSAQNYTPIDQLPYVGQILPAMKEFLLQRVSTNGGSPPVWLQPWFFVAGSWADGWIGPERSPRGARTS